MRLLGYFIECVVVTCYVVKPFRKEIKEQGREYDFIIYTYDYLTYV